MISAAAIGLAYLIGSIPFGYLIAWRLGVDIRAAGSGNIGATNVARTLGKKAGALVLALDFAKGAGPVFLAQTLVESNWVPTVCGMAAILGHMFPVWLKFSGGKGVATGTGVVAVLVPIPAVVGLLAWFAALSATRYVSLASIVGGAALVTTRLIIVPEPFAPEQRILTAFCLLAFALVLVRHWGNLVRIRRGQEHQVSESPLMRSLGKIIHVLTLGLWFGSGVSFILGTLLIFQTWREYGEDGLRIAGTTVSPMFPFYFLGQGICGFLALITAMGFARGDASRVHRIRFFVILVAVLTVVAGWPLSQKVSDLRTRRYDRDSTIAAIAKEDFGRLHMYSLLLNFGTVGLTGVAMALAAALPGEAREKKE